MIELNSLITDKQLEAEGVWITFDTDAVTGKKAELLIRSDEYGPYKRWMNKELGKRAIQTAFKRDPTGTQRDCVIRGVAEFLWVDSRGLMLDGKKIKNDTKTKIELLSMVRPLYDFLNVEVHELSNFQAEADAEEVAEVKKR